MEQTPSLSCSMNEQRRDHAAALTSRNDWVICGGYRGSGRLGNCDITSDGRRFRTIRDMPMQLSTHCLVSLDGEEGDLFVTGGKSDVTNRLAFIFQGADWREVESIPTARRSEYKHQFRCIANIASDLMYQSIEIKVWLLFVR